MLTVLVFKIRVRDHPFALFNDAVNCKDYMGSVRNKRVSKGH